MRRIAVALVLTLGVAACGTSKSGTARATIPPNSSLRVVAESLSRAGLVGSPAAFRLFAKFRGGDRSVRPGTYELRRDLGYQGLLDALSGGKGIVKSVTVPEGFSVTQVVRLVAARLRVPPDSDTGRKLRLRGRGLPGKPEPGDQIVEIEVYAPRAETDEQRELYRQMAEQFGATSRQ